MTRLVILIAMARCFAVGASAQTIATSFVSTDVEVSNDYSTVIALDTKRFRSIRVTVKNTGAAALRDVKVYAAASSTAASSDVSDDVDTSDTISDTLAAGAHGSWSCADCAYGYLSIACDATTDAGCQAWIVGN